MVEMPAPNEEGMVARAVFSLPPEGGIALANMILKRFPGHIVAQVAEDAIAHPDPPINMRMQPAVPPSPEGMAFINDRLNKRAEGYGNGG